MKSSTPAAILTALALAFGPFGSPTLAFAATQAPAAADRTVVVESFDGAELTGGAVTNDGLSAMLVDTLLAADGYTVMEKGVAGAEPRFLIKGSIVRFDANAGGAALQMGGVSGVGRALGGGARRRVSRVAVSLRLIDATSGRILAVARAEGEAAAKEADAGLSGPGMSASAFRSTSIGQALENALAKAARDLAGKF
ncbi:MAG: CsgG/HfaB family protein [Caulobacter sp.]|nr:CsgG/HfaB family protein [Caulobacter sp.]